MIGRQLENRLSANGYVGLSGPVSRFETRDRFGQDTAQSTGSSAAYSLT